MYCFWSFIHSVFHIDLLNLLFDFTLIPVGRCQNANDGLTENSDFLILFAEPPSPPKDIKLYEIQSKSARISWQLIPSDVESSSSTKNNFVASANLMDDPPINEYIIQYTHISGNK